MLFSYCLTYIYFTINFISKTNGFLELDVGGYVVEKNVIFSFVYPDEVKENTLHVDQMTMHNMPDLPIQYVGTLEKRTGGQGVTTKSKLYFKDEIPIYDIIDGFAYFPSGKHIYKISIDKFSKIKNVGSNYEILAAYRTIFYSSSSTVNLVAFFKSNNNASSLLKYSPITL